jgi:hypothetical protein
MRFHAAFHLLVIFYPPGVLGKRISARSTSAYSL